MRLTPRIAEDGALRIAVEGIDIAKFRRSAAWKMGMPAVKARHEGFDGQDIVFPASLPYRDVESIVASLAECGRWGYEAPREDVLETLRKEGFARLDAVARVGLAIKAKDPSVHAEFEQFSEIADRAMARPLRDIQKWDAFFMCAMRKSANFSVPGSGKTATTLGAFAYLREKGLVDRVVVVSPKNAFGSWRDEWKSCFADLLPCASLCFHDQQWAGKDARERRSELYNAARYNLVLLNYESLSGLADALREVASNRTLLVFDEVHKVKAIGGVRATDALLASSEASYVVALTGTPIPNSYCDIYNLLHILHPQDYDTFFGYTPQSLAKPLPDEVEQINESLQPFFCRTNKRALGVPDPDPDSIYGIDATFEENMLLSEVKEAYKNDPLALIIRCLQMESDPRMLLSALNPGECEGLIDGDGQMEGPGPAPVGERVARMAMGAPITSKTKRCIELAHALASEGKPLIIWCFFTRSMDNLAEALSKRGHKVAIICGSTPQEHRLDYLDAFRAKKIDILITNPHTLAESVSLHSVCHDAIYFEYSYNLVHLLQSKDRIHRLGLPDGQYTQYHYLQTHFDTEKGPWSMDERIYVRLKEKEQVMLDAIDRGILEPGATDKADLREVFEGLFDPPLESLQD